MLFFSFELVESLATTLIDCLRCIAHKNTARRERRAKALAEGGVAAAAAIDAEEAEEAEIGPKIGADNVGSRMLRAMGWREGEGLGADGRQV